MNKEKANGVQAIRPNISLWVGVLDLEGQYIHKSRENKTLFGLPSSKIQLLELVMMMCGYVTGSERLFVGNQID